MTASESNRRAKTIKGLELALRWFKDHPEFVPFISSIQIECWSKKQLISIARAFGTCRKTTYADLFAVEKLLTDGVHLYAAYDREKVCQRVKVGDEIVVHPAVEAQPERTEVVGKFEWHCPESLLAPTPEQLIEAALGVVRQPEQRT